MSVIKAKDMFLRLKMARTLGRLLNINDDFKARVLDDPLPYLEKAHEDCVRHRKCIEDIKDALGLQLEDWSVDPRIPFEHVSIEAQMSIRIRKIEKILRAFDE